MYKKFIIKGAILGASIGLGLSTIYAFLICVILAASSSHSPLAMGYFLIFFLYALNLGILPAGMVGAISGLVVGTLVYLERKYFSRLGTVYGGLRCQDSQLSSFKVFSPLEERLNYIWKHTRVTF